MCLLNCSNDFVYVNIYFLILSYVKLGFYILRYFSVMFYVNIIFFSS